MNARRLSATFALILGLSLSACGGDNDPGGEPPTTAPPEPADTRPTPGPESKFPASFVKKVEPICEDAKAGIDKASPIEDEAGVREAAGVYEDTAQQLGQLKPPAQNGEAYRRFVEVYVDAGKTLRGIEGEVKRGDSGALQRVTSVLDDVKTESGGAAEDYGFTKCVG